ncbi:MAG: YdbL family protein [Xanthomonadales bacterium]|nr:YdbL family protein [Xanthomonadales bacterium]
MKKFAFVSLVSAAFLAACVTINVYFPAAAAERAASQFVGEVLGEPASDTEQGKDGAQSNRLLDPLARPDGVARLALHAATGMLDLLVPSAHAQADIEINTPQINAIKARMAQRQQQSLNPLFDSGAIGFTSDGLVAIRDRSAVGLQERRNLESLVADENRDRKAVYREIAVANGHPEWEPDIQKTFAQEWIEKARSGWYYQTPSGNWVTK